MSPKRLPLGLPVAAAQLVGRVLHEARHHVLAGRCHVGVDDGLDRRVDERPLAVPAVLRRVEGALDVLDGGADVEEAAVVVDGVGQGREDRQPVEREVDLGRDAAEPHPLDVVDEVRGQLAGVDEVEERAPRVERGDHHRGPELGAVLEGDPDGPALAGEHRADRRAEPDLRAEGLGGPGQHLGEPAVAALVERPRAEVAVVLAHLVEQQHQPGARRHRADLGADDAGGGVEALDRLVLEVVLEPVRRAAGQQAYDVVHHLLLDAAEVVEQPRDVGLVLGVLAEDVGRRVVEQRLHRLHDPVEVVVVAVVGVGVVARVAADLLDVLAVVVAEQQVVAVAGRVERRRHHQRHEAVLDEVELVDDLGAQQAQRVGEGGEREAGHAAPR